MIRLLLKIDSQTLKAQVTAQQAILRTCADCFQALQEHGYTMQINRNLTVLYVLTPRRANRIIQ